MPTPITLRSLHPAGSASKLEAHLDNSGARAALLRYICPPARTSSFLIPTLLNPFLGEPR